MNRYFYRSMMLVIYSAVIITGITAQTTISGDGAKVGGGRASFVDESMMVESPTGNLYGTLSLPVSNKKVPVVLIIAGSGPTDRNGNSAMLPGANNSLKLLADALAERGIASLRYDKRGIGETGRNMLLAAAKTNTMLKENDVRFDAFIDDAARWGQKLRGDKRFSRLIIAGHSEGSLIGMVAAKRIGADAFISIAGAGRPIGQVLLEQLKAQLSPDLATSAEEILVNLAAGKTVEPVAPALYVVLRPSIQPYMISWLRFDPAREIARLTVPVLIVQGTTDIQATTKDVNLLAAGNPTAKVRWIEGMNHVFKFVLLDREKQVASYSDPSLPVVPELIEQISRFVKSKRGRVQA